MMFSRHSLLAITAVVDIALHARPSPVAAKTLAARLNLPPRHLETLLQGLVRAGILKGVRGPHGGYELARERRRISAADIVRAVMEDTEQDLNSADSALLKDVVNPMVAEASRAFLGALEGISVNDMCLRAANSVKSLQRAGTADFTI